MPMCLKMHGNLPLNDDWGHYLRGYLSSPLKWWRRRLLEDQEKLHVFTQAGGARTGPLKVLGQTIHLDISTSSGQGGSESSQGLDHILQGGTFIQTRQFLF